MVNFATLPVVYLFFPETSKRPLETIDLLYGEREGGERPSMFQVVKDSTNKEFVARIEAQL